MPPTAGRTTLHASARTNAPSTEVVSLKLIVEGAGAPPYIAVAPDAVSLGSLNDPDELQEVIVIETRELPESQPWISNASCDTASLSVRLDTVHEENLDGLVLRKYALTVSARDDWSGGTIEGSILLSSGSTGSNEIKRIRIFGDVQDGVRWSPRIISIPRDRGEKTTESVRIVLRHPHRCSSWSLSVSDSSKAHFKILGVSNAKNMSIIEVLAIKSALSEGKCSLVLETGCEEYPRIEIPVELQQ
jgi:hypothetical protein